ncbi:MAG: FAD-binding oxidoreductase [Candidatus Sericytochromatia bacterium]|nr:FAD-binding oxidoreductase [Candidatus Tanganyikabacteria bacterium]
MPMARHAEKVAAIARFLEQEHEGRLSLQKGGVSHMMPLAADARRGDRKVNLRDLAEILAVDPESRTCSVEPGVPFADLVAATLQHSLIPRLVPELKTITVGGAVAGCSVESMSFRYGGFHDSALAYEIVTGDGRVLECTRTDNAEVFGMIHGSYGSLGILTRIDFPLIPARPFVRMSYPKFSDFGEFYRSLLAFCEEGRHDFVDAIIHGRNRFVICLGTMVDEAPYTHRYDQVDIFYKSTWARGEDYIPIFDYFFRYDADCHWLSRKIPGMELRVLRRLLGRQILSSTRLLSLAHRFAPLLQRGRLPDVVLDCFIPASRYEEFFRWYEREMKYFPLWIVPYRIAEPYPFLDSGFSSRIPDRLFIDCAIYGLPNSRPGVDLYTTLEDKLYELAGLKALISRNTYSQARFWEIYDRQRYARVKALTDPAGRFRDIYEKVHCRG